MSHLFATVLLLTLGAGSAGLLTASSQPLAQPFYPSPLQTSLLRHSTAEPTLTTYLAQLDVPANSAIDEAPRGAIAATICVNLPDWQRPSEHAQLKQLETMPRYGNDLDLQNDPLVDIAKDWWSHDVFSFTTYGLSARTDPLYLSGVWTALENTWDCYNGDQAEQINQGDLAEIWLLHHRLVNLAWQDNQYVATVEPGEAGLQLVQFPRQESSQGLPLSIITTTGQALAVMSGDW
ncbi:hypothetical protein [Nodosilinea sp. E11]|uniref:hypothetical protein n=1 Tax=Nodosilinea sp. E11 TaxID=3037479 RepID=UPI0029347097|nr:hypothetical protein [Nodosilinea sp. E11]WOD37854.1 hypothetical protein RRF56_16705 [Nodosilinea sp. E11]